MLDHHADALPDHDFLHHLSEIDLGSHQVSLQDADFISEVLSAAAHELPGPLGHASAGVLSVVHGALGAANQTVHLHDGVVDIHHHGFTSPFANG